MTKIRNQEQVSVAVQRRRAEGEKPARGVSKTVSVSSDCFAPAPDKKLYPIDPLPPCFPPKVTLSAADRKTATRLAQAINAPQLRPVHSGSVTIRNGAPPRGPEGEPMVQVSLGGGRLAFVDPNTNKYYLAKDPNYRGGGASTAMYALTFNANGPYTLPKGARFSNSHFSDADACELTNLANRGYHALPMPAADDAAAAREPAPAVAIASDES